MTTQKCKLRILVFVMLSLFLFFPNKQSYGQNTFEDNIAFYTDKINQNPQDDNAYLERGFAYFNNENFEKAGNDFKEALKINPKNYNALFLVAQIFLYQSEFEQVHLFANEAIKFNPQKDPNFYLLRGYGYEGDEDFIKAKADYETVLSLDPTSEEAKARIAIVNPKAVQQNSAELNSLLQTQKQNLADAELLEKILNYRQDECDEILGKITTLATGMSEKMKSENITINDPKLKAEKAALKKEYLAWVNIWDERITQIPTGLKGQAATYELQAITKRMDLINDWERLTGEDLYK